MGIIWEEAFLKEALSGWCWVFFFSTILYVQLAGLGMEWEKTYVYFYPNPWGDDPIWLHVVLFRWVVQPPTSGLVQVIFKVTLLFRNFEVSLKRSQRLARVLILTSLALFFHPMYLKKQLNSHHGDYYLLVLIFLPEPRCLVGILSSLLVKQILSPQASSSLPLC